MPIPHIKLAESVFQIALPTATNYIFDRSSSSNALSLSISAFCAGQPTANPSLAFGFGICRTATPN